MGQPVTVYRWDDVGAPQIVNRTPSEVIDILTKCLVDGYGAKDPLGWSRPFYDGTNHVVAFRNSVAAGGSGGYVKIWDASGTNTNGGNVRTQSAISMTDLDTLFNPGFFHTANMPVNTTKWVLIGTATAFYFFTQRTSSPMTGSLTNSIILFAGDIFSVLPSDAGRFITFMNVSVDGDQTTPINWSNDITSFNYSMPNTAVRVLKIWDADGGPASSECHFFSPFNITGSSQLPENNGPPSLPQVFSFYNIFVTGHTVGFPGVDRLGISRALSAISPFHRGALPGLLKMFQAGWRTEQWPLTFSVGGRDYWLVPNGHYGAPTNCIELGEWHDPFISS